MMADETTASGQKAGRHPRSRGWLVPLLCIVAALGIASPRPAPATAPVAVAAADEAGLPFIHNFDPTEYGGSPQTWALAQDRDGMIYVGDSENGVLVFDGARWTRIPVPERATVRSLALGADGRMYVGTVGDLGYLAPDASGKLAFVSLLDKIPAAERQFADVWTIHSTDDGIYFATLSHLFRYRDGAVKVWKPRESFHLSFMVNGTIHVREVGRGLMRLVDDRLELVPGSERFADEKIYALLPWRGPGAKPGDLLAGTRTQGWFIHDGRAFRPWKTEADAAIDEANLYGAIWLADGRLAVNTLGGGIFLIDSRGRLVRRLTRASGLSTDVALALLQDRQNGLWVATGAGVSHIDVDSPLTHFGERSGLRGLLLSIQRHQGTLYAGTTEGLFRLVPGNAHFEQVPQVPGMSWGFASVGSHLVLATYDGVFTLSGDRPRMVLDTPLGAVSLLRSPAQPSRVFVGMQDGLSSIRLDGHGRWVDEGRIDAVQDEVRTIVADGGGRLWLGTWGGDLIRLTLPAGWNGAHQGDAEAVVAERFGAGAGLPGGSNQVVKIDGEPRFTTSLGIYLFDPQSRRFVPDPAFAGLFPDGPRRVVALHQSGPDEIWIYSDTESGIKETGRAIRDGSAWRWQVTPLQPIAGIATSVMADDPDGVVWLGGDKGLFRYQPARTVTGEFGFRALLREVAGHDGARLFAGSESAEVPEIPYAQNALRFEFAAPSYDSFGANRFQVLLQGLDHDWSPWSGDAYRDYTNIPDGEYRFRVRARNVYGQVGEEATFDFRVLPPWYRTAWAWALWIVSAALALALLLRWRSAALNQRNRELAALVEQRTAELAQVNDALRGANEALVQQTITDPLTGLKNRRYLNDHIEQDVAAARRHCRDPQNAQADHVQQPQLLFLMVDVDRFKEINDTHGHAAGDRVLVQLCDVLRSTVRESDTPVRWGGEEFLIVARFTPSEAGPQFAERIRAAVAAHPFDLGDGQVLHRTCSIGFASYPFFPGEPDRLNWEQVVNLADECLYAAKRHGRNAWMGVAARQSALQGSVVDALQESLERMPAPGPLQLATSWEPRDGAPDSNGAGTPDESTAPCETLR